MRTIENLEDMQQVLEKYRKNIVAVGIKPFYRSDFGMLAKIPIICCHQSSDSKLIEKDTELVFVKPRKKNTYSILNAKKSRAFLKTLKNPHVIIVKVTSLAERICKDNNWKIIGVPWTSMEFGSKIHLREIMDKCGIKKIPGELGRLPPYKELKEKYGKFVVQIPHSSGGKGTFFVATKKKYDKVKESVGREEVLVTKYMIGSSPSITVCVTKHGILCSGLQYQMIDIKETTSKQMGSGIFCGHDWTLARKIDDKINKKAIEFAQKIGKHFQKKGYKGIFGLDLLLKGNDLYIIECNPRLLGVLPSLSMIQMEKKEPPLIGFHILEFMNAKYDIDVKKVNKILQQKKKGAHLVLYNKYRFDVIVGKEIKPGVYNLEDDKIVFKRSGYKIGDIKEKGEFVITSGIPKVGARIKPGYRILRLLSKDRMSWSQGTKLTKHFKKIVNLVYKELELEQRYDIKIREIRQRDIKILMGFRKKINEQDFPNKEFNEEIFIKMLNRAKRTGKVFVAEYNDRIVGSIICPVLKTTHGEYGEIRSLYIDKNFRRTGLAKKLIEKAVEFLKSRGINDVRSIMGIDNKASVKLHESFGFEKKRFILEKEI